MKITGGRKSRWTVPLIGTVQCTVFIYIQYWTIFVNNIVDVRKCDAKNPWIHSLLASRTYPLPSQPAPPSGTNGSYHIVIQIIILWEDVVHTSYCTHALRDSLHVPCKVKFFSVKLVIKENPEQYLEKKHKNLSKSKQKFNINKK